MLILAFNHAHRSGGGGGGGAGCEEASAFDFPLAPLVCALPEKPGTWLWNQGMLILQACSYC